MTQITQWHGCYDGNLKDLIVPEAFKHPAKMSRKLCERIFDYGREQGYWQPGDTIIDPFGGIGTTGIIGAYRGYSVVCIELEEKFVNLSNQNFTLNLPKIAVLGYPMPVIIQGDSRKLLEILGQANGCVTSPPFLQSSGGACNPKEKEDPGLIARHTASNKSSKAYGNEEGQIHNLPEGDHDQTVGVISSPPYSTMPTQKNLDSIYLRKQFEIYRNHGGGQSFEKFEATQKKHSQGYGDHPDQLANLSEGDHDQVVGAITSPPWEDNLSADRVDPDARTSLARQEGISNAEFISPIDMEKIEKREQKYSKYGQTEGQLGKMPRGDLPVAGSITSPPYEKSNINPGNVGNAIKKRWGEGKSFSAGHKDGYSRDKKNLGKQSGDTYWSAVALIYQQVYYLLPSGGAFAVVIKDFVRNKKRVPLCNQTAELLETVGFDIPERIHAMLIKEIPQTKDMFTGKSDPKLIKRKSFFRRLAEKKGAPPIDWEEVIWAVKP